MQLPDTTMVNKGFLIDNTPKKNKFIYLKLFDHPGTKNNLIKMFYYLKILLKQRAYWTNKTKIEKIQNISTDFFNFSTENNLNDPNSGNIIQNHT